MEERKKPKLYMVFGIHKFAAEISNPTTVAHNLTLELAELIITAAARSGNWHHLRIEEQ